MSGHDDLGFDDDLGPGRDVLKQTIGALVDGATPSGVPSAPEQNLGLLRRRVRTWRIAKAGAVGLSTAVVISALAFSAAQASTWNRSEPLPGRPTIHSTEQGPVPSEIPTTRLSPSPTVSASPSPSASPSSVPEVEPTPGVSASSVVTEPEPGGSASGAPEAAWPPFEPFDEGYLPWAFDAGSVACGLTVGDLPREPQRFVIEPDDSTSDLVVHSFTITEVAGAEVELETGGVPEYLLFREGRLVSSSVGARDAGYWGGETGTGEYTQDGSELVTPGQTWRFDYEEHIGVDSLPGADGEAGTLAACGERVDEPGFPVPQFSTPLPAGPYEVVFAAPYRIAGADTWEIAFSAPHPITIP